MSAWLRTPGAPSQPITRLSMARQSSALTTDVAVMPRSRVMAAGVSPSWWGHRASSDEFVYPHSYWLSVRQFVSTLMTYAESTHPARPGRHSTRSAPNGFASRTVGSPPFDKPLVKKGTGFLTRPIAADYAAYQTRPGRACSFLKLASSMSWTVCVS